jgi:hypothetical protein
MVLGIIIFDAKIAENYGTYKGKILKNQGDFPIVLRETPQSRLRKA